MQKTTNLGFRLKICFARRSYKNQIFMEKGGLKKREKKKEKKRKRERKKKEREREKERERKRSR